VDVEDAGVECELLLASSSLSLLLFNVVAREYGNHDNSRRRRKVSEGGAFENEDVVARQ
jgi:hypothetical protein